MFKTITKLVTLTSIVLLTSCSSGGSDTAQVNNTPAPPEVKQYYGVWSGSLLSSIDGKTTSINIIINGSKIYIAKNDGYTGQGDIISSGSNSSATLSLYNHFPSNMFESIRNPSLGAQSNDSIQLSLELSDDVVEGRYTYLKGGAINDKGVITTLKKALSDITPTTVGIMGTYFNHEFYCDSTNTQTLLCYSYLTLTLDSALNIAGQYSDKFFYSTRPNGIPASIPSSFSFTGNITKIPNNLGLYVVNYTLPNYGSMGGIGYVNSGGLLQYVAFSADGNYAFRIE